jgi:hypothetical protein
MELVATRRPFAYVPLRKHWEQQHYVDYRLRYYDAGIRLDFRQTTPAVLAALFQQLLTMPVSFREVPRDSARRAATRIASLLLPPSR